MSENNAPKTAAEIVEESPKTAKPIKAKPAAPPRASSSTAKPSEQTETPKGKSFTDELMEEAGWTPE